MWEAIHREHAGRPEQAAPVDAAEAVLLKLGHFGSQIAATATVPVRKSSLDQISRAVPARTRAIRLDAIAM